MTHFIIDTIMEDIIMTDAFETLIEKVEQIIPQEEEDDQLAIQEIKTETPQIKIEAPISCSDIDMKDNFFGEFQKILNVTLQSALEKKENKAGKFIMMTNVIMVNN